jgi:Bacterial regulatory helix-turn-helix protein, lysR family
MELRHLRYFVAVADKLLFRQAAERMSLAQGAFSEQVRKLYNAAVDPGEDAPRLYSHLTGRAGNVGDTALAPQLAQFRMSSQLR